MRPWLLLVLLASMGCGDALDEANPAELRDQSGAVFGWSCSDDNEFGCTLIRLGGEPPLPPCPDEEGPPFYSYWSGRFFDITGACDSPPDSGSFWTAAPDWARSVVCESDANCPQLLYWEREYECRNGFCQDTDHAKHPPDEMPDHGQLETLCIGHLPRYEPNPDAMTIRAEVNAACQEDWSEPCNYVPESCPTP